MYIKKHIYGVVLYLTDSRYNSTKSETVKKIAYKNKHITTAEPWAKG